jgi:hypothetical protein
MRDGPHDRSGVLNTKKTGTNYTGIKVTLIEKYMFVKLWKCCVVIHLYF